MQENTNWPNAPLVFVLAVVRISTYPNFERRLDDIHESLLEDFPERLLSSGLNIQIGASQPSVNQRQNFRIMNSQKGVSVLLREDLIAIEWANYIDFGTAAETIKSVLGAAFYNLPHLIVQHIGLRYVNAILESANDTLEEMVDPGLLASPIHGKLISSTCGSATELEENQRVSITLHRSSKKTGDAYLPPGIEFPPNLNPNPRLKQFLEHNGGFGLLDADGGVPMRLPKESAQEVMAAFTKLRDSMRPAFESAVTDRAISRWSTPA